MRPKISGFGPDQLIFLPITEMFGTDGQSVVIVIRS